MSGPSTDVVLSSKGDPIAPKLLSSLSVPNSVKCPHPCSPPLDFHASYSSIASDNCGARPSIVISFIPMLNSLCIQCFTSFSTLSTVVLGCPHQNAVPIILHLIVFIP